MKNQRWVLVVSLLLVGLLLAGCVGGGETGSGDEFNITEEDVSLEEADEEFDFNGEEDAEQPDSEFDFTEDDLDLDGEDEEPDQENSPEEEEGDPNELPEFKEPPTKETIGEVYDLDPCLVGTWVVDNQTYLSFLQDQAAESGYDDGTFSDLEGRFTVTFNEDWTVITEGDLELGISSDEGSITSNIQYSADGLYAVDRSEMIFFGDADTTATFMGESSTADGNIIRSEGSFAIAEYSCRGDTLQIDTLRYYRMEE